MTLEQRREILDQIAEQNNGHITPELLVAMAKNPDHPLHYEFDWNDASAAHKHRLATARQLIRSVTLEIKTNKAIVVVPCYVRDPEVGQKEQGYISLPVAKKQEHSAQAVVTNYLERIEASIRSGHVVALGLGLETEFLAGLQRILVSLQPKKEAPRRKKTSVAVAS